MNRLQKVRELPLPASSVDAAVRAFIDESDQYAVPHDKQGLYSQTLENIAACLMNKGDDSRHFWLAWDGDEVAAYVLCSISRDVDNRLCYWMTQCWVNPKLRRQACVKEWFQLLREEAKRKLCKHIIIPASRNSKAYLRFLGQGWHEYTRLLKEDI
jgi:hypothetical protein